jgi:hypothetical protein
MSLLTTGRQNSLSSRTIRVSNIRSDLQRAAIERKGPKSLASDLRLLETPGYLKEFRFTIFYMFEHLALTC